MLNHKRGYSNTYIEGEKCYQILPCSVPMLEGGHVIVRRITLQKLKSILKTENLVGFFPYVTCPSQFRQI